MVNNSSTQSDCQTSDTVLLFQRLCFAVFRRTFSTRENR